MSLSWYDNCYTEIKVTSHGFPFSNGIWPVFHEGDFVIEVFHIEYAILYYSIYLEIISIKCAIGKHETSMNCLPRLVLLWNTLHKNSRTWVWEDGSAAAKNTYCSYRGPRFSSQHPHPTALHTSKATRYARVPRARMQAEHSHNLT